MGNLLGSPVTDKETHVGQTSEFEFGLSSMQGWRVHMEDAHIAEANLYAVVEDESLLHNKKGGGKNTNSNKRKGKGPPPNDSAPSRKKKKKTRIPLPGHSFFGVFDGHGGTFAAQYTGDNLCRILAKQPLFVEYAQFYQESMTKTFATNAKKIQFLRSGVDYLEGALKQAFVELDCEIAMAVRGTPHPDANQPYRKYNKKIIKDGIEVEGDDEFEDDDDDMKRYASSTTDDDSSMPSADSPTDMMEAARQAAASQAKALDDDGDSGTTACCVLVTPDWLVCANAGDSRAVFSKSARAVPLSYDHKPDDEGEERRIRTAGGYVAGGRVEGDLAVSRGLGDFRFKHMPTVLSNHNLATNKPNPPPAVELSDGQELMKPGDQKVSPVPDIILQTRNREQDEFVIVACDGIWDVRSNQECVGEVSTIFQEGEADIGLVCEELIDTCLRLGSKDNMTALVVKFNAQAVGEGGGVVARRKERDATMQDENGEELQSQVDENADTVEDDVEGEAAASAAAVAAADPLFLGDLGKNVEGIEGSSDENEGNLSPLEL